VGAALVAALVPQDPVGGGELVVTRLECLERGIVLEGRFSLGWIGRLTPAQLEFVGLLLLHRGNIQKLAAVLHIAYITARSRLDAVVAALLDRLAAGEIAFDEALRLMRERG
jgi:hypothetical protein